MLVKLLRAIVYGQDGRVWWTEGGTAPAWVDIEAAIRRLDRDRFPFIWLFQRVPVEEDALPDFNVIGGEGCYAFDCRVDGVEYRYHEPRHTDGGTVLWRSDQGYVAPAEQVCCDIAMVLQAARYFCAHGAPDPGLPWWPRIAGEYAGVSSDTP